MALSAFTPNKAAYQRWWRAVNREKVLAHSRKHYAKNKDKIKLQREQGQGRSYAQCIERKSRLKTKYGISVETYDAMLIAQNFECAICHVPHWRLHIDHNHKTNAIRQLLCERCNHLLGHAYENPTILQNAIEYLARHS